MLIALPACNFILLVELLDFINDIFYCDFGEIGFVLGFQLGVMLLIFRIREMIGLFLTRGQLITGYKADTDNKDRDQGC